MAVAFLFIDWFYLLWIVSLSFKFPEYANSAIMRSFLGMMESLHKKLGEKLAQSKDEYEEKYKYQRQKLNYI